MNTSISVYNTVTALGADCAVAAKKITLVGGQGTPPNPTVVINYPTITNYGVVAPVTEVAQVTTGTPTAADLTVYSISLEYMDTVQKKPVITVFSYTSLVGATATQICDAFRAKILAEPQIPIVGSGTTTLILTAVGVATSLTNGSQAFTVTNTGTGVISFNTGTAAVAAVGLGYLYNQGATANANIVNTTYYYTVIVDYSDSAYGDIVSSDSSQVNKAVILVANSVTDYLTLVGTYGTLTSALAGKSATWSATGGNPAFTTASGVITLATDTVPSLALKPGDVVMIGSTTSLAGTQTSVTLGALSSTTLQGTFVTTVAAAAGYYVKFTSIL